MIELARPLALVALLAIPLIVFLHMLRPRRRAVVLSTTELWKRALRERQRGLGLTRLLRNLSLILLLLFAAVCALGLSSPQWSTQTTERDDIVLVLDVSASMGARDALATRFDAARQQAHDLIDALPEGGRMLIMTSGREARLRTGFEGERAVLHQAVQRIDAGDEAGRPREALTLALSLLRNRDAGRVYFVTDAAFDESVDLGSPRIEYRRVGEPGRNVAITRFDLRPEPQREDRFQLLLTLRNYTAEAVQVPVSAELSGRTLFRRSVSLAPDAEQIIVLPFDGSVVGVARARIDVDDDLAADDQAFAAVNARDISRVLLVGPGNVYLESVLSAAPGVRYTRVPRLLPGQLEEQARRNDVVILDGVSAPRLPAGRYLLINTVPPGLPFTGSGVIARPALTSLGASALIRNLDLSAVSVDSARRVAIQGRFPGLQRLFGNEDTELALALLDGDLRLVYLGFDLARSNLPLQAAFPLFLFRSLAWLRPPETPRGSTQIPAGEAFLIRAPAGESELIMRWPSGDAQALTLSQGELRFHDTARAGIYRYTVSGVRRYFAVNLTHEGESDITPRATLPAAVREDAQTLSRIVMPLWPYLAAIALALLVIEWVLWCVRRRDA